MSVDEKGPDARIENQQPCQRELTPRGSTTQGSPTFTMDTPGIPRGIQTIRWASVLHRGPSG
eukprot:15297434-Alexandrium_andersonii.AAC.1